ncbi:V-Set And Immunoglobulin Domain-Containing Protein 10-Like [Manis pentadactyla]|nr:V-Set And Immunoglobulin Domain-Containing Protein 10-Like [Manis pentadactyla]
MAGRGVARGPGLRLRECQHGCKEHLGNTISFFFRFLSGNLARGLVFKQRNAYVQTSSQISSKDVTREHLASVSENMGIDDPV